MLHLRHLAASALLLFATACAGLPHGSASWDSMKYSDYAALGGGFLPQGK